MNEKLGNIILFDWLTFSSKIDSPESLIKLCGLDNLNWISANGRNGYRDRLTYNDCISVLYNGRDDMGVCLDMTGQGCRVFDEFSSIDFNVLFSIISDNDKDYNVTRLDVAYDDFTGVLDLNKIYKETEKHNYTSRLSAYNLQKTDKGLTIYIGSFKSDFLVRFYDKALERGREDDIKHWVRCELQMRHDKAFNFIRQYLSSCDIGKCYFGVINNYLRYVDISTDSNKSRCKTSKFWSKFISSIEKISIYTPCNTDYNKAKCDNYVCNVCGNAVYTCIRLNGIDAFLDMLKKRRISMTAKYKKLLDEYDYIDRGAEEFFIDKKEVQNDSQGITA